MERKVASRYDLDSSFNSLDQSLSGQVLFLTIDIGNGQQEELVVRENDDPAFVASAFCAKHRLGVQARESLISQIQANFEVKPLISANQSWDTGNSRASGGSFSSVNRESKENLPFSNVGEKLYLKGLRFKEKSQKKQQKISEEKNKWERSQVTFKPKINSTLEKHRNVEDELIKKGKEVNMMLERKREEIIAQEMSQCTFTPSICSPFDENSGHDRFLKLYENAKIVQNKLKNVNDKLKKQECPFKPDTRVSRRVTEKAMRDSNNREKISQSRKAIEDYLKEKNSLKDPKTGQDLFKPVIGRPPKFVIFNQRKVDSRTIGDHLYSLRSHSQCSQSSGQSSIKTSSNQSEKLVARVKEVRFEQIFLDLKPNSCDLITPDTIKSSTLSPKTLKILTPLLNELKDLNERLNFSEFCESMEILMKTLTPEEKSSLLKTGKGKPEQEHLDFKPKINESQRPLSVESLYERNLKKMLWVKEKCELEKKRKEESQMVECTFKPKILKYSVEEPSSPESQGFEPFRPLSESFYF